MPIGAHVSIAGGIWNAPERAAAIGCECFQLFTRSPQGGPAPALTDEIIAKFKHACEAHGQRLWVVHTPYYINLASKEERTRQASVRVIRDELDRASLIGATYVMTHLGSARDAGVEKGRVYVIAGLTEILRGYTGSIQFLIEISAGAGAIIGATFEEIAEVITAVESHLLLVNSNTRQLISASASTPSTPSPPATTSALRRPSRKHLHTSTARSASRASKCLT